MLRPLRILLVFLAALAWTYAAPCMYKSRGGNLVSVELRTNPNRAMVYESVNGTTTFMLTKVEDGKMWFACDQIRMRLLMNTATPAVIVFGSMDTEAIEAYTMVGAYGGVSPSMPMPSAPSPSRPATCYTCSGMLRCPVCHGSGHAVNYTGGPSTPCSACGGSGRCYHCHGTGRQ